MRLLFQIAVIVSLFICIFVVFLTELNRQPIKKDCSLAEISPDFTPKERQICRINRGSVK
jgi:hypothetical protein